MAVGLNYNLAVLFRTDKKIQLHSGILLLEVQSTVVISLCVSNLAESRSVPNMNIFALRTV